MEQGVEVAKARVRAWLERHGSSARKLGLLAGVSANTVARIVEPGPYTPGPVTWRKIARACGWDERELLALVDYEAPLPASADPWAAITRELLGMGYPLDVAEGMRQTLEPLRPSRSDGSP